MHTEALRALLHDRNLRDGTVLILTGAGISTESGIPDFRGADGYWTAGSANYMPEQMATQSMFRRDPDLVWAWYLYRRNLCRQVAPNSGHHAIAHLQEALGNRALLITQNVDGLHLRAQSPAERTYQIHGNIMYMRCSNACSLDLTLIPEAIGPTTKGVDLLAEHKAQLRCPRCNGPSRPHVLWFDECYDEALFHYQSSIAAAQTASILMVIGTSGATNLPSQLGSIAATRKIPIIDINLHPSPFSTLARRVGGYFAQGNAAETVPEIVDVILEHAE